jgi:hypothetical protein
MMINPTPNPSPNMGRGVKSASFVAFSLVKGNLTLPKETSFPGNWLVFLSLPVFGEGAGGWGFILLRVA